MVEFSLPKPSTGIPPLRKKITLAPSTYPDQHLSPYSGCRAWKPKFFIKIHLHWEWRVFVVWCSNGAHLKGFCLYFLSTIKFLKNPRFFVTKTVSNLSSLQTKVFAFSTCPNRRLLKIWAPSRLSKSVAKYHEFCFLNYEFDEVSAKKFLSACEIYKSFSSDQPGGGIFFPPPKEWNARIRR